MRSCRGLKLLYRRAAGFISAQRRGGGPEGEPRRSGKAGSGTAAQPGSSRRSGAEGVLRGNRDGAVPPEQDDELLNVYDAAGEIVGARPRGEAKRSGLAVGAVNVLVRDRAGRVLLQKRPADKENGGRWDKSVGGHVAAGEDFDATAVREAGEELFDDGSARAIVLARSRQHFDHLTAVSDLAGCVVLHRIGMQLNLRDVRIAPGGGVRNVVYHVAMYEGRTAVPLDAFRRQPSEIDALAYFSIEEVDRMLTDGALAPNMAFLWLAYGHRLLT